MSAGAATAVQQIEKIVGAENFSADPLELSGSAVDGVPPAAVARPGSADEVAEIIRRAAAEKLAVIATGARTKLGIGAPPSRYDVALDLSRLDRVLAYDPADLTLSVEAGIPLSTLQKALGEHGQFLPLAPPFAETCTIGGVLGANVSGPLRHFYGSARDFVLGMEFATGEGVRTKSGGRVVKNVAGMDLHKLLIGSLGTLGVITVANFRTFPLPRATGTFLATYEKLEDALDFRRAIVASPLTPHTLEIISPAAVRLLEPEGRHLRAGRWSVAAAAGGEESVVERHASELKRMAVETRADQFARLDDAEKARVWQAIREFPALALESSARAAIVKVSVLPSRFGAVLAELGAVAAENDLPAATLIRAAGIVYIALLPEEHDAHALNQLALVLTHMFQRTAEWGTRAMMEWCPPQLKRRIPVWGALPSDFPLMQRMKKVFDPHDVLAPGRFLGGI